MVGDSICMGCQACVVACPIKCITIEIGNDGFEKVNVNKSKCVSCGKCESVCQILNPMELSSIKKLLIATQINIENNDKSTSAGIAYLLMKSFIDSGGVVATVSWNNKYAEFITIERKEDLDSVRGSKYVYPEINGIYKTISTLSNSKKVLFIGLPCHIMALKHFDCNKDNIYTVDLVCHGAPQKSFLADHLSRLGFNASIESISFRQGSTYRIQVNSRNQYYSAYHYEDEYLYGFLNGLLQKEYCFKCDYSSTGRVGDITLGDAWNQRVLNVERAELITVNSQKGFCMLKKIQDKIVYKEMSVEEFVSQTGQLSHPTNRHQKRSVFEQELKKTSYHNAVRKSLSNEMRVLRMKKKLSHLKRKIIGV